MQCDEKRGSSNPLTSTIRYLLHVSTVSRRLVPSLRAAVTGPHHSWVAVPMPGSGNGSAHDSATRGTYD
jgi:hypothetical protein